MWRKPEVLHYWAPPLLWGLAVLSTSGNLGSAANTQHLLQWLLSGFVALDTAQLKIINFYVRKGGHALAYGAMFFLWLRALRWHAEFGPGRAILWSLGFCLLFAAMDEGRQWFHPSRGGSLWDVLLDMGGAGAAALFTATLWPLRCRPLTIRGIPGRPTRSTD
jgi:VanZ family protein